MAPVLGLLFLPYLVHPHYLMLSLPAGHVLAAWGILPPLDNRRWRPAAILVLLVVVGVFWLNRELAGQAMKNSPSGFGFNRWALAKFVQPGQHQLALGPFDPIQGTRFSLNSPAGSEPFYLAPLPVGE